MANKILLLLTVAASVSVTMTSAASSIARPPYPPPPPYPHVTYKQKGIPYSFSYGIKDDYVGADFGQEEKSDGELVQGSYYVALPDGRLQTVKYQADHVVGYVADVEYQGDAIHPIPIYQPVVAPLYPAPPPVPRYPPPPPAPKAAPATEAPDAPDTTYPDELLKEEA